jgi:RimJ/RimL family protein N-acetyltransferase
MTRINELPMTTLTADGIVLRPIGPHDVDDITASCNDEASARFLPMMPVPYTRGDAIYWLETMIPENRAAGGATFAIADPATGRMLGAISANGSRANGHATSVGYWVSPWARGRGVATTATRTLVPWLFEHGFGRIELTTDFENEASQRVALASGFHHEAVRRAGIQARDRTWYDQVVWTRLVTDSGEPTRRLLPDLPPGGLTDGVITLRRLSPADLDDLYALHTTPDVAVRSVRPMPRREDTAVRCGRAAYAWLTGAGAEFVIHDAATGGFVGDIGLFQIALGQGMIGYSLRPEWRGRAYATRAARLVTDWGFDHVGLVRIVAGTAPDNVASQRTLEKAGFAREGFERSRLPGADGGRVDNVAYAILASDRQPHQNNVAMIA